MFTIEQINEAHLKVKTGADFPLFVQDLIKLGVTSYTTYVADGRTDYIGTGNYTISSAEKYNTILVADNSNTEQFETDLKAHQQGKKSYSMFCKDCAKSGVEKWVVDMQQMTCTYFSKTGKEMLAETIPVV